MKKFKKVLAGIVGWAFILYVLFAIITSVFNIEIDFDSHKPTSTYNYQANVAAAVPTAKPTHTPAPTLKPTPTPYFFLKPSYQITNTVYITESGEKYHRAGCQYLWHSCIEVDLSWAKSHGYTPCSKCNPPG